MCGIAGLLSPRPIEPAVLDAMTATLAHRGPDGHGIWLGPEGQIGLGHRRLAIVDPSPAGNQPMVSRDRRFVLSFNGEIYNHQELRAELDERGGRTWVGRTDTETLLECISAWGLERTLARCAGMFAIALWDVRERKLHLVRDRFGEKPLYYGWIGDSFAFASELKAIRGLPGFDQPVERRALGMLLRRAYIPAPLSIHQHVYKLQPGCILTADLDAHRHRPGGPPRPGEPLKSVRVDRYWSYRSAVIGGLSEPIESEAEAVEQLDQALRVAVRQQSQADVPVGAFLSGGVDSSTLAAYQSRFSGRPLRTFTLGFDDAAVDEAGAARRFARHLGAEHHELYLSQRDIEATIPLLPAMYDEPFADSSQIPTHVLCRFARADVVVALCGDGGDELFGGYNRHIAAARYWPLLKRLPRPLRRGLGTGLGHLPAAAWNLAIGAPSGHHVGHKIRKALKACAHAPEFAEVLDQYLDEWPGGELPLAGGQEGEPALETGLGPTAPEAVSMMYLDAVCYLPDDILAKVDRASMAVSMETRMPFLDHRVAELAARMPLAMKIAGRQGKQVLRRLLERHVPEVDFRGPKKGFGIKPSVLLRGPLRDWAEQLLDPKAMAEQGFFDPAAVRGAWRQHLDGAREWGMPLWAVLMFQAWLAEERAAGAGAGQAAATRGRAA